MAKEEILIKKANDISAVNRNMGVLVFEMLECNRKDKGLASLACLFLLLEQSVVFASEANKDNTFFELIEMLFENKKITTKERVFLHKMRKQRNSIFHENINSISVTVGGKVYPLDETDNLLFLFREEVRVSLTLIYKLLK